VIEKAPLERLGFFRRQGRPATSNSDTDEPNVAEGKARPSTPATVVLYNPGNLRWATGLYRCIKIKLEESRRSFPTSWPATHRQTSVILAPARHRDLRSVKKPPEGGTRPGRRILLPPAARFWCQIQHRDRPGPLAAPIRNPRRGRRRSARPEKVSICSVEKARIPRRRRQWASGGLLPELATGRAADPPRRPKRPASPAFRLRLRGRRESPALKGLRPPARGNGFSHRRPKKRWNCDLRRRNGLELSLADV